ncbi:hypothetical protein CDL12_24045 [Handroanthus impetiginosus]|uniref:Uncharacterized protein n=1 Tax=Handroanthus impetiginosus TaxID=429701 RepID=A0A2G9GDS0_9LAMI|nr:hypothetical protein CDL12_24045 [Handroanthus impetiginosus]
MAKRAGMIGFDGVRRRREELSSSSSSSPVSSLSSPPSLFTRGVNSVFAFVRFAEFEILFVLFFLVAFIIFKDLTSRPEYNDILVKKPGGNDWWPY